MRYKIFLLLHVSVKHSSLSVEEPMDVLYGCSVPLQTYVHAGRENGNFIEIMFPLLVIVIDLQPNMILKMMRRTNDSSDSMFATCSSFKT